MHFFVVKKNIARIAPLTLEITEKEKAELSQIFNQLQCNEMRVLPVGTNKLSKEQMSIRNPKIPFSKARQYRQYKQYKQYHHR